MSDMGLVTGDCPSLFDTKPGELLAESVCPLATSNSGGTSMAASLYESITGTLFICNRGMAGGRNGEEPRDEAWDEAKSESICERGT